jgi:hypothetical protein
MQVTNVAIVATIFLTYFFTSGHIQEATRATAASTMDMSLALVLVGMQPLLEANHSTVVVADSLKILSNQTHLSYVITYRFFVS